MWNELVAMVIGFGIAVVVFMLFAQKPAQPAVAPPQERIIIRQPVVGYGPGPWWGPPSPGGGPYYARLPFRPLFY